MIAIAGPNLPIPLLAATGRFAGALKFDPDRETPRADAWLESKFAPWAPPLLEAWAHGEYNDLDEVLFSRADDTSQRLYYYICELQRRGQIGGPEPLILDVCKIPRQASLERTITKLKELAERLGVGAASLQEAIDSSNRQGEQARSQTEAPVCLLAGTAPPDLRLHKVIENCGYAAAGSTLEQGWLEAGDAIDAGEADPFAALGRHLHASTRGPRSFADAREALTHSIAASAAQAVVLWRIEEDEAQCWQLPAERETLEAAGIPSLILTRRDWHARDGAPEEIANFLKKVQT
ncbi:2-hydroxyacyl-CoA dehydratase family protein [Aurantiacibacter poecillastricola]|uniref:2-hydroxyacyl-CoA dehydratase family protein n=1 Tax=Aurantiacibacter poecillastricola TaxID=3064385 RepID=UPI00273E1497|nr:2-hydroxyacyl-CoA dehydratase family protein [Aurantiacibacter sp. 219JJ12-13]MDP5261307.1 2-hydroxyacyl-CoA dehydratase family protein [Aurantiacibacter sp. 219JJ12-13]